MAQFHDVDCGLLVVWKRCKMFTGGYDAAKLRVAWVLNILMLLFVVALLLWDILSYYGKIPFGQVFGAMVLSDLVALASALFLPLIFKTLARIFYEWSAG